MWGSPLQLTAFVSPPCSIPCPWPPPLSFFLSFLNKIWWGEGLEEPRPGLCSLRDISPGGPPGSATIRLSHHWTGLSHPSSALAVPAWTMDLGVGWRVPKSSLRPSTPAAQLKGGGWKLGENPSLPRGACCLDPPRWNWRQGTWREEGRHL